MWHRLNAKLPGDVTQIVAKRLHARGGDAVHAYACFVHQLRGKRVGFAQSDVPRFGGLGAGGERTAVGDARKWSRDKLRAIRVTDTGKHLVLVAEILIDAGIKLVRIHLKRRV